MTRQAFIRVLLSLLLLVSQQMATAHALSHLTASLEGKAQLQQIQQAGDQAERQAQSDDLSSAFAQDQSCNQCLAIAQLGGPLPSHVSLFAAPLLLSTAVDGIDFAPACSRIILGFQSRGPPQA